MESTKLPETVPALSISPAQMEVVFAEGAKGLLSFVSPPLQDMNEMAMLERSSFSLKDAVSKADTLREAAVQRLRELSVKQKRFAESPTFLNRIANLHSALGNFEEEIEFATHAFQIGKSSFLARKVGEAHARVGELEKSASIFSEHASVDSYAALRMASFCVINSDFDSAEKWLSEAISLNPAGYAERLFQGAYCLVKGDAARAITYLKIALDDRPNSSVAYSNLGLAYLSLHRADKAFDALKRSVALDPFNKSALIALADVSCLLDRDADAVNSLRYFVEFEQRDAAVWGRLARSLLRLNLIDDCVHALKRQGALKSSVEVWNNLGVAYAKQNKTVAGLKAFSHAISLESEDGVKQDLLVARNACALVSRSGKYDLVLSMTESILSEDTEASIAKDEKLADMYSMHLHAMMKQGRTSEALQAATNLLKVDGVASSLTRWIVSTLAAVYGLERNEDARLMELLDTYSTRLSDPKIHDARVLNNLAFAFAEMDRIKEADACINRISWAVHKDAYVTATLGLISMRKGNIERGQELYREAISLAANAFDKNRIRQKLNLELARVFSSRDKRKSQTFLKKVVDERRGEAALERRARKMLISLTKQ